VKTALICGISGQDGAYLAELLLSKGYRVAGTSRDPRPSHLSNLKRLNISDRVNVVSLPLTDYRRTLEALTRIAPDEVYQLSGQSSVELSFRQPGEALESNTRATLNLLEAIRTTRSPIRLYHACSSECFGNTPEEGASEATPFAPRSPYAVAKAASYWLIANYREAYGMFACSGILFNHESPLRPQRFVTRKVVAGACRIKAGSEEKLQLGDLSIYRDWGWAPEYVDAMWSMLQRSSPEDFVIASGRAHSLEEFVATAFDAVGLDWRDHVGLNHHLKRPSDVSFSRGRP
jgi:GDPmannose 4,6-dehydratase